MKERLRGLGFRLTEPRLAVLDVIENEGRHKDAEFIISAARTRVPRLSRQAVYDNLNALVAAGVLRRIEPAGSPALYETRVGDNHHHLVCRVCTVTLDIDCVIGEAPCLAPAESHGFEIDEAEIVFWGICPQCKSKESKHDN